MSEGFLSQEEIDALLRGEPPVTQVPELTDMQKDAIGEIGNISMGSAATTLSILLGRRVSITTPRVSISTLNEIKAQYPLPYIVLEVGYLSGLTGANILAMRESDALIIADLMMGNDGSNPPAELNELYLSAVTEAMNQMMGSTATSLSTVFNRKVDISPPTVNLMDFAVASHISKLASEDEPVVKVAFRMEVEDLIDSEIMQILSFDAAREMVDALVGTIQQPPSEPPVAAAPPPVPPSPPKAAASSPPPQYPQYPVQPPLTPSPPSRLQTSNVTVQPVQFAPLKPAATSGTESNIALIMDVPLQVTVELGRTKKLIREILELAPGSVIELDKLAGEPVDVLVNGKLIAKGEVVVIDENFGVRITDIVSKMERVNNLQ